MKHVRMCIVIVKHVKKGEVGGWSDSSKAKQVLWQRTRVQFVAPFGAPFCPSQVLCTGGAHTSRQAHVWVHTNKQTNK